MASLKEIIAKKKQQIAEQTGKGVRTVRLKVGKNRVRLLPSWRGEDDLEFWRDFGQHYIKGMDGKMKSVYVCVDKTYGKPCPVCEAVKFGVDNAESDTIRQKILESRAQGRVLVNALVESDRETPVILELSPTTFEKILDIVDQEDSYNVVTDLKKGIDLIIIKSGAGITTEYNVTTVISGSKPVDPSVMERINDLDLFVAQENEAKRVEATNSVKALSSAQVARSKPSRASLEDAYDEDDDIPDFPSKDKSKEMDELDELDSLLEEIDD